MLGVYIRTLLYGGHHYEWKKCIAVIERKVLIVSLFSNASDYSNKTCIYRYMCLCLTKYTSLVGVVTYVHKEQHNYHLSLNYCNTFLPLKMAATIRKYMDVYECDITINAKGLVYTTANFLAISWIVVSSAGSPTHHDLSADQKGRDTRTPSTASIPAGTRF